MPLGVEVGLAPGHIVLDGDPALPPQKRGHSPQFSVYVYCGRRTAGWIKMPLDITDVGLGPRHIVLDGDPAPPSRPMLPDRCLSVCLSCPVLSCL